MADQSNQNECAHPSCTCPVPGGEKYCGPHCETAPETAVICGCGHQACRTAGAEGAQVA
jgi:hypothetical protein